MFDSLSKNAISTKARAMYGKRITKKQYEDMVKLNSVNEAAAYLKNETHYSSVLSGIRAEDIHRGQLENLIKRGVIEEFSRLYHYLYSNHEDLFRYEIMEEDIKEILRMILLLKSDSAQDYILDLPTYMISRSTIDLIAMAKARSFDELLAVLEHTRYAHIIKKFRPTPQNPVIDYISCEHAFINYYFNNFINVIKRIYKGEEREQLLNIAGLRVELLNISIIYRSKAYFQSPSSEIVNRIFPYYHKLSAKKMGALAQAQNKEELEQMLNQTYLRKKLEQIDFDYIEHFVYSLTYHTAQKYFRFSTSAAVSFYAFTLLRSIEIMNITNIIEGIRYNVPREELKSYIII